MAYSLEKIYNWKSAQCFGRQRIFRNWAADCAAWKLLPERDYPNRGNCRGEVADEESEVDSLNFQL